MYRYVNSKISKTKGPLIQKRPVYQLWKRYIEATYNNEFWKLRLLDSTSSYSSFDLMSISLIVKYFHSNMKLIDSVEGTRRPQSI